MLDAIRRGASDIHFEPYEKMYRVRLRIDGILKEIAQPPVQLAGKRQRAPQGHVAPRHRRAPRAAGRPHQDEACPRPAPSTFASAPARRCSARRSCCVFSILAGHARHRRAGLRAAPEEMYLKHLAKPQGMILVTGPTGSGKTVSLYTGLQHPQQGRHQHLDRRGSGGNQSAGRQPGQRQQQGGPDLRLGAARLPAPGPGRGHGRRNPRPRDRRDRDQGRADRTPGALHAAHQRCAADPDAPDRHGRQALRHRHLGEPDHRPAPGAPPVLAAASSWSIFRPRPCARKASRKRKSPGLKIYGPKGCPNCTDGYKGRVGLYQVMEVTEAIGRIIMAGGNAIDINDQAIKEGVWDLRRAGLEKVKAGLTSLDEINSVTIE